MILELDEDGKLYIREITNDAWEYLQERRKEDGDPWEWYFSKHNYFGNVRVYYNPHNLGSYKLIRYMDELRGLFNMECSPAANLLLNSWREICKIQRSLADLNQEKLNLEINVRCIKKILSRGCISCANFRQIQDGDDDIGACVQGNQIVPLNTTPLCVKHGGYGSDGMYYLGQKHYPHDGCKYLQIEGEKV